MCGPSNCVELALTSFCVQVFCTILPIKLASVCQAPLKQRSLHRRWPTVGRGLGSLDQPTSVSGPAATSACSLYPLESA